MTNINMPEPSSGALVLRSYADKPDEVLIRDDEAASEWDGAADDGERWFTVGDYDSDPLCWEVVTKTAEREGATLARLSVIESGPSPALAERVRIVGEIRQYAEKARRESFTPSVGVALGAIVDSVADMVNTLPEPLVPVVVAQDEIAALAAKRPLPAADQPVGAIVTTEADVYRKNLASGSRPWCSPDSFASDEHIDRLVADGAELLRGEWAK